MIAYSRPLDSFSGVLLIYHHQQAKPHLFLMEKVEVNSVSSSFSTPEDYSDTVVPHFQVSSDLVFGRASASPPGISFPIPPSYQINAPSNHSNRDVVLTLLHTFSHGQPVANIGGQEHIDAFEFGAIRRLWQEIKNRIELTYGEVEFRHKKMQANHHQVLGTDNTTPSSSFSKDHSPTKAFRT